MHPVLSGVTLVMGDHPHHSVDSWFPAVYGELRRLAHHKLLGEAHQATLNTTALVHEAYLKLARSLEQEEISRQQFFGLASQAMRRILVDYARSRLREKRGGGMVCLTHHDDKWARQTSPEAIVALHEAMERLGQISRRQSQVIEYWFFGGFKQEEIAEILEVSLASVRRDWRLARAWLSRELKRNPTTAN